MTISNDIELQERKKQNKLRTTHAVSVGVGAIDLAGIGAVFSFFTRETLRILFEQTLKFVFFPIAAVAASIQAILAWRQAHIQGYKKDTVVKAAVETVAAVAITAAVGIGLFATAAVAAAAPIIFSAVLGAKTLFHAGSAMFYWGKSAATTDPVKKADYRSRAVNNGIQAVVGGLLTVAVATVLVFGKVALAGIGIAAASLGVTYLGVKAAQLFKGWRNSKKGYQAVPQDEHEPSVDQSPAPSLRSSADISGRLTAAASHSPSVSNDAVIGPGQQPRRSPVLNVAVGGDGSEPAIGRNGVFSHAQQPVVPAASSTKETNRFRLSGQF